MSALTGNFAALKELEARIAAVGREGYERVEQEASKSVAQLLEQQFDEGAGPDGAWASLKPSTLASGRTPPPLTAKGNMRRSASVSPTKGIRVRLAKPAGYHQSGTSRMDQRAIVPTGTVLPAKWKNAVSEAAMKVLRERFG